MGELHWACNSKISYHLLIEIVSNLFMLISVFQPWHLAYDKQNSSAWSTLLSFSKKITAFSISGMATKCLWYAPPHTSLISNNLLSKFNTEGTLLSNKEISACDQTTTAMCDHLCILALHVWGDCFVWNGWSDVRTQSSVSICHWASSV